MTLINRAIFEQKSNNVFVCQWNLFRNLRTWEGLSVTFCFEKVWKVPFPECWITIIETYWNQVMNCRFYYVGFGTNFCHCFLIPDYFYTVMGTDFSIFRQFDLTQRIRQRWVGGVCLNWKLKCDQWLIECVCLIFILDSHFTFVNWLRFEDK